MCPIRLLPAVAVKSIRKQGIESTNMLGVQNVKKKKKANVALMHGTIGDATIIKHIPHDKRLQQRKSNLPSSLNNPGNDVIIDEATKHYNPFEEDFYKLFEPEYIDCEFFIKAIGYDIDVSTLMGHSVSLTRSASNKKTQTYKNNKSNYIKM